MQEPRIPLLFLAVGLALGAQDASAKDDTPNAKQLAVDHPWHPREPSVTTISVTCGKAPPATYALAVDGRSWLHLTGSGLEAAVTPFGRFIRTNGRWKTADEAAWLTAPNGAHRTLRELFGAPLLPDAWRIGEARREGAQIVVRVGGGRMEFDATRRIWTALEDVEGATSWRVTKTARFSRRTLPSEVEFTDGCRMVRTIEAAEPQTMPTRKELLGER